MRHWLWPFAAVMVVAALLFAGLLAVDSYARARIVDDERYRVAFADIECNPPPGMTRAEFLDEVQYYDSAPPSVPARFSLLEPNLEGNLSNSFGKHPWVFVATVELKRPRTVSMHVTYRKAVLAVVVPPRPRGPGHEPIAEGQQARLLRGVDSFGVVMPRKAPLPAGTLVLDSAPGPKGAEGQKWGDPLVEFAALTATSLEEQASPPLRDLHLTRMQWTPDGLLLWGKGIKVIWGKGELTEPKNYVKIQQLVQAAGPHAVLTGWLPLALEIDVRPAGPVKTRLVLRAATCNPPACPLECGK
jgi:hypothetical protein